MFVCLSPQVLYSAFVSPLEEYQLFADHWLASATVCSLAESLRLPPLALTDAGVFGVIFHMEIVLRRSSVFAHGVGTSYCIDLWIRTFQDGSPFNFTGHILLDRSFGSSGLHFLGITRNLFNVEWLFGMRIFLAQRCDTLTGEVPPGSFPTSATSGRSQRARGPVQDQGSVGSRPSGHSPTPLLPPFRARRGRQLPRPAGHGGLPAAQAWRAHRLRGVRGAGRGGLPGQRSSPPTTFLYYFPLGPCRIAAEWEVQPGFQLT